MSVKGSPAPRRAFGRAVGSKEQWRATDKRRDGVAGKAAGGPTTADGKHRRQGTAAGEPKNRPAAEQLPETVRPSAGDHLVQVEQPEDHRTTTVTAATETKPQPGLGKRLLSAAGSGRRVHPLDDGPSAGGGDSSSPRSTDDEPAAGADPEPDTGADEPADGGASSSSTAAAAAARPPSTLWSSVRAVMSFNSSFMSKKRRRSPPRRVDSFLERFTTRRRENSVYGDGRSEADGKSTGGGSSLGGGSGECRGFLPRCTVDPDGSPMFYWLCLVALAVEYNLWLLIAREAWPGLQEAAGTAWFVLDYTCDLLFLADVCVQFRTEYLERGILVSDGASLARNYVRSRSFALDLLALTPTDLLYLVDAERLHPICRLPRLLKCYRLYSFYYMAEGRASMPAVFRVFNICHLLLLLVHWLAAFYFLFCARVGFGSGDWVYPEPEGEFNSTARMYLMSFYWSTLTLTLLGDIPVPNSELEYVFQIVSYLIGIIVFATIVGQVGIVIENRNALRLEFERHVDNAKKYMRTYNVAKDLQNRVLLWYFHTWKRSRTDVKSLGPLPTKLRAELAMHVHLKTLKKVSIFTACPPEFLHDLVLKMHTCIYTPGDLVCRRGEVAREMFIISDGLLEVVRSDGEILSTLQPGDFFGEIGLLNLEGIAGRRTADVRSVGYSELFTLSKGDVLDALMDFPQAQRVLEVEARRRLSINRRSPLVRLRGKATQGDTNCTDVSDAERQPSSTDQLLVPNGSGDKSPVIRSLLRDLGVGKPAETDGGGGGGGGGSLGGSPVPSRAPWRRKPAVAAKPSGGRTRRGSKASQDSAACRDSDQDEAWLSDLLGSIRDKLGGRLEQSSRENQQLVARIHKLEDELKTKEKERDKMDSEMKELRKRVVILEDLLDTANVGVA